MSQNPAARERVMRNLAAQFKGTHYGQRAARGGGEAIQNINTWPHLSDAEQAAALKKQKAFFDEVRHKLNNDKLQFYETEAIPRLQRYPRQFHQHRVRAQPGRDVRETLRGLRDQAEENIGGEKPRSSPSPPRKVFTSSSRSFITTQGRAPRDRTSGRRRHRGHLLLRRPGSQVLRHGDGP